MGYSQFSNGHRHQIPSLPSEASILPTTYSQIARVRLNILDLASLIHLATSQQLASDPGRSGPTLEIVHLYNDLFPQGIAVSSTSRNGIVIVDLGIGESCRHLHNTPEVKAQRGFVPFIWGEVVYSLPGPDQPVSFAGNFGADGIAMSADGETLFWAAVESRTLYSIRTVSFARWKCDEGAHGASKCCVQR